MRLAIFTLKYGGKKIAVHPSGITITADQNPYGGGVTMVEYNSRGSDPIEIQGTFEEAVDEVNRALVETPLNITAYINAEAEDLPDAGKDKTP